MIRCVMADDHVLVREILCKIMEQTSTIRIIGIMEMRARQQNMLSTRRSMFSSSM